MPQTELNYPLIIQYVMGLFFRVCYRGIDFCLKRLEWSINYYGYSMAKEIWTRQVCETEALKYNTLKEFREGSTGAYKKCVKRGWLYHLCRHMNDAEIINRNLRRKMKMRKGKLILPNGYWTKEKCWLEALKCNTRGEFSAITNGAYNSAYREGWLDEICSHMEIGRNTRTRMKGRWTMETSKEEALKYETRGEFYNGSKGAYNWCWRNECLDEVCDHMEPPRNTRKTCNWTKEKCQEEALKYETRSEFYRCSSSAYQWCWRNECLDEVCDHMSGVRDNELPRCIYAHMFPDRSIYIGLTCDVGRREENRSNDENDAVTKYKLETGYESDHILLTDYIDEKEAQEKEKIYIEQYRKEGWNILNRNSGGGLGGGAYLWDEETSKEEALKYETRGEFSTNSGGAYQWCWRNGKLEEFCSHMPGKNVIMDRFSGLRKVWLYWTKERCKEEALKYKYRKKFQLGSGSAYYRARVEGWLDEVCDHMEIGRNINRTIKDCAVVAMKYNSRSAFQKGDANVYQCARRRNWLDEICSHMEPKTPPKQSIEDLFE